MASSFFDRYSLPDWDNIDGPNKGFITLPLSIWWQPGGNTFDLSQKTHVKKAYAAIISEGSAEAQESMLNKPVLIDVWPTLPIPKEVAAAWEDTFDQLSGNLSARIYRHELQRAAETR